MVGLMGKDGDVDRGNVGNAHGVLGGREGGNHSLVESLVVVVVV